MTPALILVQALNGWWNVGPVQLTHAMRSEEHGTFPTAASAVAHLNDIRTTTPKE